MAATASAIRAGQAFVELFADESKLVKGLNLAAGQVREFGKTLSKWGVTIQAAGAAVMTPMLLAAMTFLHTGDALDKMSARTGVSVEALSSLQYAAGQADVASEDLEGSLRNMQKTMFEAANGGKSAAAAIAALGLTMDYLETLAPEDQFLVLLDRISRLKSPTDRAAAAMEIFGKNGTALLPMIAKGAAGINVLTDEAKELGLVMSGEQAAAAAEFADAWGRVKAQLTAVSVQIGAALAPLLTELAGTASRYLRIVIDWTKEHRGLLATMFTVAAAVAAFGATLSVTGGAMLTAGIALRPLISALAFTARGFGFAIQWGAKFVALLGTSVVRIGSMLTAVIMKLGAALVSLVTTGATAFVSGLGAAFGMLFTPIGLLAAAIVGLGALIVSQSDVIGNTLGRLSDSFFALRDDASSAWQGIADALAAGDLGLAAQIGLSFVKIAWTRLTNDLAASWAEFKSFFLNVWANATAQAASIWTSFVAGVEQVWITVKDFILDSIAAIVSGVLKLAASVEELFTGKNLTAAKQEVDDERDIEVGQREQERQKRQAQIEEDRKSNLDNIEQERADAEAKRAADLAAQLEAQEKELQGLLQQRQKLLDEAAAKRKAVEEGRRNTSFGGVEDFDVARTKAAAKHSKQLAGLGDFERGTQKGFDLIASALGAGREDKIDQSIKLLGEIKTNTGNAAGSLKDAPVIAKGEE